MPSIWYEVFPRTVVEAYAAGVPVRRVSARQHDRGRSRPARPGCCSSPRSGGARVALRRDAGLDALCVALGDGGRRCLRERFNPAGPTDRLLAIYRGETECRWRRPTRRCGTVTQAPVSARPAAVRHRTAQQPKLGRPPWWVFAAAAAVLRCVLPSKHRPRRSVSDQGGQR